MMDETGFITSFRESPWFTAMTQGTESLSHLLRQPPLDVVWGMEVHFAPALYDALACRMCRGGTRCEWHSPQETKTCFAPLSSLEHQYFFRCGMRCWNHWGKTERSWPWRVAESRPSKRLRACPEVSVLQFCDWGCQVHVGTNVFRMRGNLAKQFKWL